MFILTGLAEGAGHAGENFDLERQHVEALGEPQCLLIGFQRIVELSRATERVTLIGQHFGFQSGVTDLARQAVNAHVFLSTSSSFRAALPPGPITQEAYLTALPYKNSIVTAEMRGDQLLALLTVSAAKRGSDAFSQISGARYTLHPSDNSVSDVQVLADPTDAAVGYIDLDPTATYLVATTNFQALIAADYKDIFAAAQAVTNTEIDINELVSTYIRTNSPVAAEVDGRIVIAD